MKSRVLVTGSRGYVAANLIPELRKLYRVVGYDILDGFDILDGDKLAEKMKGCKYVFHLAAISGVEECKNNPNKAVLVNQGGTDNVMAVAVALNVKPVLFSSQVVNSENKDPDNFYKWTKLAVESHAGQAVILRPSNIYGGKKFSQKKNAFNYFLKANPIMLNENKTEKRDFIHVSKVVQACLEALTLENGVYDVQSGDVMTVETLARIIATARKAEVKIL